MLRRWQEVDTAVPDAPAIESGGVRYTFAEADALTDSVAKNVLYAVPDDAKAIGTLLVHAADNPDGTDEWPTCLENTVEFERIAALHEPILGEPYATELARHLRKSLTTRREQ
jgi:hypothetical protein